MARVAAVALLSLIASFALTIDPCSGEAECGDGPCHILCTDGCTTTPVPAIHLDAAPLASRQVSSLRSKPLAPPLPDLAAVDRPPRSLA